jgi:hydroxymethylpyrimidine pyrophosphatase-like HAD family hydrolase
MKKIVAFDLDGTLALSKQPLTDGMADLLSRLLAVAQVAVISGGDWPQFEKQVASRLPASADVSRLWMMPTSGAKLYLHRDGDWQAVYAELFTEEQKAKILKEFDASLEATGFTPEETWGERIEDRGSQITFSALGQQAPLECRQAVGTRKDLRAHQRDPAAKRAHAQRGHRRDEHGAQQDDGKPTQKARSDAQAIEHHRLPVLPACAISQR